MRVVLAELRQHCPPSRRELPPNPASSRTVGAAGTDALHVQLAPADIDQLARADADSSVTSGGGRALLLCAIPAAADQQHNDEHDENHKRGRHAQ